MNAPSAKLDIPIAAEYTGNPHNNNERGCDFDTACGGAGAAADEHQNQSQKIAAIGEYANGHIHGIKARRSRGNRAKESDHRSIDQRISCVLRIVPFKKHKQYGGDEYEDNRHKQYDFGMQTAFPPTQIAIFQTRNAYIEKSL